MNVTDSVIPQSDDRLLSYFAKETAVGLFSSGNGDIHNQNKKENMLPFVVLGLILIVATEPFKVLLRKNIGKLSLSMPRLVTACVLYFIWAGIILATIAYGEFGKYAVGLYAGAAFYILFSLFILILGIKEYSSGKMRYNQNRSEILLHLYRGDPVFFSQRIDKNKAQELKKIWLKTEPLFCFWTGLILTVIPALIHPIYLMIGLPILLSAISFWFNEWFQINNVWDVQLQKVYREQQKNAKAQQHNTEEGFFSVN